MKASQILSALAVTGRSNTVLLLWAATVAIVYLGCFQLLALRPLSTTSPNPVSRPQPTKAVDTAAVLKTATMTLATHPVDAMAADPIMVMPTPAPIVSDSNGNVYPIDPNGKIACAVLNMAHLVEEFVDKTECYTVAERRARLRILLLEAARALEYQKIEYWLDSGSLLGAVREHDVRRDDVDTAIGLTQAAMDQLRQTRLITLHPRYALFLKNSPNHRDAPFSYPSGRFVDTQTGLYTNVFEFFPTRQPANAPNSIATGTLGAELML